MKRPCVATAVAALISFSATSASFAGSGSFVAAPSVARPAPSFAGSPAGRAAAASAARGSASAAGMVAPGVAGDNSIARRDKDNNARMGRVIVAGLLGGGVGLVAMAIKESLDADREAKLAMAVNAPRGPAPVAYAAPPSAYAAQPAAYFAGAQNPGNFRVVYNRPDPASMRRIRRIKL